jgi:hypothetical protein
MPISYYMEKHKNMVKNILKTFKNEEGLNVIEVIIASMILVVVLVSSSLAIVTSVSTATTTQERNEAAAYAQNILAIAKQAPFDRLALKSGGITNPPAECETQPQQYNNLPLITQITEYPELVYCQTFTSNNTDTQYVAYTYITQVNDEDFDNTSTDNIIFDGYVPIRVTVKILWGEDKEYITTYVRTPTLSDCLPLNLSTNNTSPAACLEGRN